MNTLLKKLSIILGILVFPIFSYANQISSSELNNQINKGNILSDSYNSLSECTTTKDGYNKEYSNYKRSECFLNGGKYYYFICELGMSCMVNLTQSSGDSSQTTTNTNEEVPNKQRLDAFLSKVRAMKNEVKNDTKYEKMLIQLEKQLKVLGEKYRSNTVISQMIGYLENGVKNIKKDLVKNKDVDTFFCELSGGCENTNENTNENINENTNENGTINTSTTGSTNTEVKVDGQCGIAQKTTLLSSPTQGLCSKGISTAVRADGSSAWAWRCEGTQGGSSVSCFAYNGNEYINLVNGNGIAACNKQIYDNYGYQKYNCSIGGGCSISGGIPTTSNPSANPQHAGVCIKLSDWNKLDSSTQNQNNNTQPNRDNFIQEGYNNTESNTNISTSPNDFYSIHQLDKRVAIKVGDNIYEQRYFKGFKNQYNPTAAITGCEMGFGYTNSCAFSYQGNAAAISYPEIENKQRESSEVTNPGKFDKNSEFVDKREFKIFIPKGLTSFGMSIYFPQGVKASYAMKFQEIPTTTQLESKFENGFIKEYNSINIEKKAHRDQWGEYLFKKREEIVLSHAGGGVVGINWSTRNPSTQFLEQGGWLYIRQIEGPAPASIQVIGELDKKIYLPYYKNLIFDNNGDPIGNISQDTSDFWDLKSCGGGTEIVKSSNGSQSCTFSRPSTPGREKYAGSGTNGGTISGTCGIDGQWEDVVVNCPNSTNVISCKGGAETVKSSNGSQSCSFTRPSMISGQTYNAIGTNNGTIRGVCGTDGQWKDIVVNCPNSTAVKSCGGGTETVKSSNGTQSCTFTWPSMTSGQTYNAQLPNGGTLSGVCGADGNWKDVVVNCPNITSVTSCGGGTEIVKSSNGTQSCSFTRPSKTAGQSYSGGGSNGGTISGTCGTDGQWKDVVVSCPNK